MKKRMSFFAFAAAGLLAASGFAGAADKASEMSTAPGKAGDPAAQSDARPADAGAEMNAAPAKSGQETPSADLTSNAGDRKMKAASGKAGKSATTVRNVLADLHKANQMEIKMGKMAKEMGQSEEVRSYGETLIKDHETADEQVKQVASAQGIQLTPPPAKKADAKAEDEKHDMIMEKLHKLSGAEFDKAFAAAMVQDHQKDIAKLKAAQSKLGDSQVKDLIAKVLPTLENHLRMAEKLQQNS
jgi:putative membrane protein